jgi:uncharacterized protein
MNTPFVYGKIATDNNFTDRHIETELLVSDFLSGINTLLISPRRWGKSSLVNHAANIAKQADNKLKFCFIDLYNIRNEEGFYQKLAEEILKITNSKMDGIIEQSKLFLGNLVPRITFSPDSSSNFSISFDWNTVKKNPDSILDLSENIAAKKGYRIVICIDEFQNSSTFGKSMEFQQKLRAHWQHHQNCSYCLYGSKRHMLMEVFSNPSMPFYQFGNILFLDKIKKEEWIPFIVSQFIDTKKQINEDCAGYISELAEFHPYYVQQLSQLSWFRTKKVCNMEIIREAFDSLLQQLSLLFQTRTDELVETQINFLRAVLSGEMQLTSKKNIEEYRLGSSANVLKLKKMLINKEILDLQGDQLIFLDPMYKHWLKNFYFK